MLYLFLSFGITTFIMIVCRGPLKDCDVTNKPPKWIKEKIILNVGGLHTSSSNKPKTFYSQIDTKAKCHLSLPPLPRTSSKSLIDPVVGVVDDNLILCHLDQTQYKAFHDNTTHCWLLKLSRRKRTWFPMAPPQHSLFLPATTVHKSELVMVGGSRELLPQHHFHLMSGSKSVQKFNVATRTWSKGVDLPAPLFEGCAVSTPLGLVVIGDFEEGEPNGYILADNGAWSPLALTHFTHTNPACSMTSNGQGIILVTGNYVEMLSLSSLQWSVLPKPNIDRSPEVRPTLGVSFGALLLTGGLDLGSGELSDVIETWDDHLMEWRLSSIKVKNPTIRHSSVAVSIHLMDYCDI